MKRTRIMNKDDVIQAGKNVLTIEGQAVQALAQQLDERFAEAVEMLEKTPSRVIVIGMGKSGLIGRKMAATLSSCGTPALFIHPAEAGHGDLGMIIKQDVVIAISYSGETREIIDLLEFIKRIGVKLISITGNRDSRIARYSDVALEARVEREAEPSGLVPTASSTAALAMGDALAVTLMKKKGFNERDFAFVHPKGQAGKKLLKVSSLMHKGSQVPSVPREASMQDALDEMSRKRLGMTSVVDDQDRLLGVITDGDLRRLLQKYGSEVLLIKAKDCMTSNPITIAENDLATRALSIMEDKKVTSLIIQNTDKTVAGIIHLHDLWRTQMF
jgi:arabinose-5-phosphate isomerase